MQKAQQDAMEEKAKIAADAKVAAAAAAAERAQAMEAANAGMEQRQAEQVAVSAHGRDGGCSKEDHAKGGDRHSL